MEKETSPNNFIEENFEAIYKTYFPKILNFLRGRYPSLDGYCEDLVQDTFIQMLKYSKKFRGDEGVFNKWLHVSSKNLALNYIRKRKKLENIEYFEKDILIEFITPENILENHDFCKNAERAMEFHSFLDMLKDWFYNGKKMRELAEDYNIPIGTVKPRIRYFRKRAKKELASFINN